MSSASVDSVDRFDLTSLDLAIRFKRVDVVHALISCGVDASDLAESVLELGVREGHPHLVRLMLTKNVKFNPLELLEISANETVTEIIYDNCFTDLQSITVTIYFGHLAQFRRIVEAHPNVNARMNSGNTLIHLATANERSDFVAFLLEKGARIDILNDKYKSPLRMALDNFEETRNTVFWNIAALLMKHQANKFQWRGIQQIRNEDRIYIRDRYRDLCAYFVECVQAYHE